MICIVRLSVYSDLSTRVFLEDARGHPDDVIGNRTRRAERYISGSISEEGSVRLLLVSPSRFGLLTSMRGRFRLPVGGWSSFLASPYCQHLE